MAYGPPTKKPKIHNEAANQRELSPQSNENLVIKSEPFPEGSFSSTPIIPTAEEKISEAKNTLPTDTSAISQTPVTKETVKNNASSVGKKISSEKKTADDNNDDPFGALDWKDGIATLPGSNLKFKLTEFGTLEIVSTVETENGEYEWSTPTQHRKTSETESSKKGKKSPSKGNSTK